MAEIYVPIDENGKEKFEQQTKIINDMMKKGWKHLGYTALKDRTGKDVTVAILFADFLWMEECKGIEKPEVVRKE